jgi:hypothetical protein
MLNKLIPIKPFWKGTYHNEFEKMLKGVEVAYLEISQKRIRKTKKSQVRIIDH